MKKVSVVMLMGSINIQEIEENGGVEVVLIGQAPYSKVSHLIPRFVHAFTDNKTGDKISCPTIVKVDDEYRVCDRNGLITSLTEEQFTNLKNLLK